MANYAKEALDKLMRDLLQGKVSERTGADALVFDSRGKSPADLQKEVVDALMKGKVSERSGVDGLVYESN